MSAPRFSIVMLLPEARGLAEQSVRSWTADQDFPREQFELIVVSNGCEPDVDVCIPPLLGASDRLLQLPGAVRTELYDSGARAARGEFVTFTESHCLAEPTFLSAMDRFLRSTGLPGANCYTRSICRNALGHLEAQCFQEGLELYLRADDWRKVNVHAFTLRRDTYLEVGGMNPRYDVFAEMILAAELWRRGYRVGLADAPLVGHLFDGHPGEVRRYNEAVVAGEMGDHRDHPRGPRIEHTYLADGDVPWSERELERAAFAAMWAERRRCLLRPALRQGWRVLKLAAREGRVGRTVDHVAMFLAALGCRLIGEKSALARRLFLWMWATAARLGRKEYLATEPPAEQPHDAGSFRIDEIPECDLWGFHLLERWQGEPMRWAGRCAVIRLPRPAGACELVLQTNGVGWPFGDGERACSFYASGERLPPAAVSVETRHVRSRLDATAAGGSVLLAVVCDPVLPEVSGESRELGFPLFRVEARAIREAYLPEAA